MTPFKIFTKNITHILLLAFFQTLFFSCDKNKPKDNCPNGYEGEFCDILMVSKFTKNWRGIDSCRDNQKYSIYMSISKSLNNEETIIQFIGPYGERVNVKAQITASNNLKINKQFVDDNDEVSMYGNFTLKGDSLVTESFYQFKGNPIDSCKGVFFTY